MNVITMLNLFNFLITYKKNILNDYFINERIPGDIIIF
jgi:hypothetical protein